MKYDYVAKMKYMICHIPRNAKVGPCTFCQTWSYLTTYKENW